MDGILHFSELRITQDGLRNRSQLDAMIEFVKRGGIFTRDVITEYLHSSRLVGVNEFEDGRKFVHDGHHRLVAIKLSGVRDFLYPEEYFITKLPYARYTKANFSNGWYTPFDPRTHVRVCDFGVFKDQVIDLANDSPEQAIEFIEANRTVYLRERTARHEEIESLIRTEIFEII